MSLVRTAITYDDVLGALYDRLDDPLLVPNLGTNTAVLLAQRPAETVFYMWGGMGLTHSIGLGVALARPERSVVILDGDGSLLMGLSGLATIGIQQPGNLLHIVLDNSVWGNTGGQPTHTADGLRLEQVAMACNYPRARRVSEPEQMADAVDEYSRERRCTMIVVPMQYYETSRPARRPEPVLIKHDFMNACLRGTAVIGGTRP
jgi:thiamine pyrophosphate-dependent acetolactate synthase large subunit-like protein